MIRKYRSQTDRPILPLSQRATYCHGVGVYHHIKVCKSLSDTDLEPAQWGWKLRNDYLSL